MEKKKIIAQHPDVMQAMLYYSNTVRTMGPLSDKLEGAADVLDNAVEAYEAGQANIPAVLKEIRNISGYLRSFSF